jgi:ATP-binding protein involved in chromosome partitioning
MRRCFSTSIRYLSHENPLVRPHDDDFGALLNSTKGLPRKSAPPTLPRAQRGLPQKRKIQNVSKIVAVSSAKGGVGKSTIAGMRSLTTHFVQSCAEAV